MAKLLPFREGTYSNQWFYSLELDIVPPAEGANMPEVTPEQRAENDRRMAIEDSIRNAYVATFITEKEARKYARRGELCTRL